MDIQLEERVDNLEAIFGKFMAQTGAAILRLERSEIAFKREMSEFKDEMLEFKNEMKDFKGEMLEFKNEMKDFKDEMLEFKNEMKDFKDEMLEFKNEMRDFKGEMSEFKGEMRDFKDEMHNEVRRMNKQWGELSNKMGTMVEDLVYPSLGRIINQQFNIIPESIAVRLRKRLPDGRQKEFDAIAVSENLIFLNSTKSSLQSKDIDDFVRDIQIFREFFPEYHDKKIVGILATLTIDDSVLTYAEKKGFLILAVGDEIMEVKNSKEFQPKYW